MFNRYQGKAVERLAHEVSDSDRIQRCQTESTSMIDIDGGAVYFKHYEPVKPGDFIVYLKDDDIYHCSREVFLNRNHIEGINLDFGTALKIMKSGGKVSRTGWNGDDMYAFYIKGGEVLKVKHSYGCIQREHLALKTAQGDIATWNPSTWDCLANDWYVVE